jgi:NADP-dependent 3-hydroxy acid dehydrogenase YdfG
METEQRLLDGRTALITGASSGIGRETARVFAREGANTAVAARRRERLVSLADRLEDEYGADSLALPTDVTDENEVNAMVEQCSEAFGGIDVVVCSAGVGRERVDIDEMSTDHYRSLMSVNVDGLFFTTRAALPYLREAGGNLIFVGSAAARFPVASQPIYAATKWWTRGFALSLSGQMERDGVGVTLVNPSEVRTEIVSPEGTTRGEQHEEGEVLDPSEVAEANLFAALQSQPTTVTELDLFRRDLLGFF